jgi:hypothetical protein
LGEELERDGIRWVPVAKLEASEGAVVVLDSYQPVADFQAIFASPAPVVAFRDDQLPLPMARLVIRSGPPSGHGSELAGPAYACLGPSFWSHRPAPVAGRVGSVLVTTGGGDRAGTGPALAERLRDELAPAEIRLVRGPYGPAVRPPRGITLVDAPDQLLGALVESDLVVSSAGRTLLETLAAGVPRVAFVTAENQAESAAALEAAGAVAVGDSRDGVVELAARIAHDFELRERQARIGRELVDGRGALRVASAVLDLLGSPEADGWRTPSHAAGLA